MVECICYGKCVNDIVRLDEKIVVKVRGQKVMIHVCMMVEVNETGNIIKVDEYYNKV